jgi:mannose-6-phosphate isomerase
LGADLVIEQIFELQPVAKNYHWGKKGRESLVARLLSDIEPERPYAELWYGAHPSSPNMVVIKNVAKPLSEVLKSSGKQVLGEQVFDRYAGTLPFLFKVLSIAEPLSIQAHPDLKLAVKLHQKDPTNYPDCNHKPEIAIAITELELLHGFRNPSEVIKELSGYKSMTSFLNGLDLQAGTTALLSSLVHAILNAEASELRVLTEVLLTELHDKNCAQLSERERLLLNLHELYGSEDPGVLFSILLRHLKLSPFQAIYTAPNVPHAYLKGDILECMATSDNVVRAGLTPKFKDAPTLLEMLDFSVSSETHLQVRSSSSLGWVQYPCPAPEFLVEMFEGTGDFIVESGTNGPQLYFCLDGQVTFEAKGAKRSINAGGAVLLPDALLACRISVVSGKIFRVSVPLI